MMRKPKAVLISDIHFNLATLPLAETALRSAMAKASTLDVPLIIAGDLTDGKAIIRGEVSNLLCTVMQSTVDIMQVYVIIGNHDLLNEKGQEHALHFLAPYCNIVQSPTEAHGLHLIPYQTSTEALQAILDTIPKGSTIICHQGVQSAFMGHYVQDKTSLPKEAFADFRVISGHYHRAQDIKCGRPRKGAVGLFSYIGNPFTLTFGEAEDGPKGIQVLYDDGLLEQAELPLRRHIIWELTVEEVAAQFNTSSPFFNPNDLLWLKVSGPRSELAKLNKAKIGQHLLGHSNYKLDLIPTDSEELPESKKKLTGEEIFDILIEMLPEKKEQKNFLKKLWREVV